MDAYPTRRPTDADHLAASDVVEPPSELVNLPWIDVHNHAHTLSWDDRERYALAGCRAMVMVSSGSHWMPYYPARANDVRYLWDDAIDRRAAIERNHFFEARLAVGVQTQVSIEDVDGLLSAMDRYCGLDEVVAVGETGITPSQQVEAWAVEDQQAVVREQMAIADRHDLPVILHTPSSGSTPAGTDRRGVGIHGYEKNVSLDRAPVIDADEPALEAVKLDVDAAADAGLPEERIVASHAGPHNVPYLAEETDCYLSFTIGHPWLTGVSSADVAEAVAEYGPERIMVDTDTANVLRSDVFSIKRAIFDLYHRGVDPESIRQIVYENPREVFGLAE